MEIVRCIKWLLCPPGGMGRTYEARLGRNYPTHPDSSEGYSHSYGVAAAGVGGWQ